MSGVTVATMITSTSLAVDPALLQAHRAASTARSLVATPLLHNVPFADSRPLRNPLVVGRDHLLQVSIRQQLAEEHTPQQN